MPRQIGFQLEVELDKAVHGYGHGRAFEDENPDMRELRVERGFTVPVLGLREEGDEGEEDADEAVLEDGDVDNL